MLTQYGYDIATATATATATAKNASEAMATIANDSSINMVLSDVIMPDTDGFQLAKDIRKQFPTIKIQLASGYSQIDSDTEGLEDLLDTMLSKPFSSDSLLSSVRNCLDKV